MEGNFELIIYSVSIGGAVFCIMWALINAVQQAKSSVDMPGEAVQTSSLALKLLRPGARWAGFLIGKISARIEMKLGREAESSLLLNARIKIRKMLDAAGSPERLNPDEVLGLVCECAIIGLAVGLLVEAYVDLGFIPILSVFFFAYMPFSWLRRLKKRREHEIRKLLPYTIDLLALSVTAGLDFTEALSRIVDKLGTGSALSNELGEMLRQIRLGKSRAEALRDLSRRVDVSDLNSVVSALIQTDELGGNLGPILRAQSHQLRVERSMRAEKLAMEAPVKILFPLIFFIFPTIFIMIFGPIAVKYLLE